MKQLDVAMNALRQQALKAAQENLKGVASKIAAATTVQREAEKKFAALNEENKKLIEVYKVEAEEVVKNFEEQWGSWDQPSTNIKVVDLNKDN